MADPRSKIARDFWGRILDHGSWICYIEILNHIEFQYGGSKIQDPRLHGTLGEESWIMVLDLL